MVLRRQQQQYAAVNRDAVTDRDAITDPDARRYGCVRSIAGSFRAKVYRSP
jgi:hypothetical protein